MNRLHPVCVGANGSGQLQWAMMPMEMWQILQQYRKQYTGDFGENWMWLVLNEKSGLGWHE